MKRVIPFLKVDQGLMAESDGAQHVKPMPGLDGLHERARDNGVFGTKMRSVTSAPMSSKASTGRVRTTSSCAS